MSFFSKPEILRFAGSEHDMENQVVEMLHSYTYWNTKTINGYPDEVKVKPDIFRQVHIKDIKRRSDIIVSLSKRKVINIELKLLPNQEVINQAIDHFKWANRSYVCLPVCHMPQWFLPAITKHGLGVSCFLWKKLG